MLRSAVADERYRWIGDLTGDGHRHGGGGEGLVKPLGMVRGLSDLPWHKDCGQGKHSYTCNGLTTGISVTGADRLSGALGVIRAATAPIRWLPAATRSSTSRPGCSRPRPAMSPSTAVTRSTVPIHPWSARARSSTRLALPPMPGDDVPSDARSGRVARAALSDVQDRIAAADNPNDPKRYRAGRGR